MNGVLFPAGGQVALQIALRTGVIYLVVLIGVRLSGKREVGQMTPFDLTLLLLLSNSVQNAMTGGRGELAIGLSSAFALLVVGFGMSRLFVRAPSAQRIALGVPVLLVNDGTVLTDRMRRERVDTGELMAALRQHGLAAVEEVSMVVLEVDGSLSVVPKQK